jgi:TetR/AcrR family transcriptional regulator
MQRARQTHQKRERREAILAMALDTLRETPYWDITMSRVAERAGLVKGTLYLYFATKEELFLEVLREQFHGWFWDLETGLATLPRRGRVDALARLITAVTVARPEFRLLLGVLHGILEQNLPEETALSFKREWLARTIAMGALLERPLPFLTEGQGVHLLFQLYALIIGLQCLTEPAVLVRKLLEQPELAPFRLDFGQECLRGTRALMAGLKAENGTGLTSQSNMVIPVGTDPPLQEN